MRRRLGLAEVLVKKPEIAILDEPTQGLDPESAAEFLELITYLKQNENISILLASHLLNQVQEVCDRVGLFSDGKMVISGTVGELSSRILGGRFTVLLRAEGEHIKDSLSRVEGVQEVLESDSGEYEVECACDIRTQLAQTIHESGGKLYELSMHRHTLDTIYKTYFQEVAHAGNTT
jgi:ABC-2 type transport system ATP-binding protein